ncbi:UMP kinase [Nanoarchaeota archaeon]
MKTTLMSLGGSTIVPKKIDIQFLKRFKKLVLNHINKGHRIILVCGGGSTCRKYQEATTHLTNATKEDKDWVGIMATRLNAELIRIMFKEHAYHEVVYNPHTKLKTNKRVIVAAGHKPGCTTDTDTAVLATQFKAHMIINTTDVDYVYDKDPNRYKGAKKIKTLTWKEFFHMFGHEHKPGMHIPFDPIGSKIAMKHKMKVAIVNGQKLANLKKLLDGKEFVGTVIG